MTKSQKYKRSYAPVLLRIAGEDFETLGIIFRASGGRKENVCFMAQQVAEKCLKALLVDAGIPVPFTHSIELLLSKLDTQSHPPQSASLDALTEYALIRRYEEGYAELDAADLAAAFEAARSTLEFCRSRIKD
jgi:HEPN domain-containing protein